MKRIPLGKERFALVDDSDFESISRYHWHLSSTGRAARTEGGRKEKRRFIYMHRQIMGFPEGLEIDHVNGNPLDNQRSNLRKADRTQNQLNGHHRKRGRSGYRGVWWKTERSRLEGGSWEANVQIHGVRYRQGGFKTPEAAAKYRDEMAARVSGGYSVRNFDAAIQQAQTKETP